MSTHLLSMKQELSLCNQHMESCTKKINEIDEFLEEAEQTILIVPVIVKSALRFERNRQSDSLDKLMERASRAQKFLNQNKEWVTWEEWNGYGTW